MTEVVVSSVLNFLPKLGSILISKFRLDLTKQQKEIQTYCKKYHNAQIHIFRLDNGTEFVRVYSAIGPDSYNFEKNAKSYVEAVENLGEKYVRRKNSNHFVPTHTFLK